VTYFPDATPDEDLTPAQRLLLAGFRDLLDRVQPPRTRPELTSLVTKPDTNYFILEVEHDERPDLVVGISLFEDEELMAYWGQLAHDDFFIPSYSTTEAAIHDALGFVEQAICGRFEVDATFRGDRIHKATTYWISDDGHRQNLRTTGVLLFNPFRPKRRETIRFSFVD
jgi:hypothetical protein